MTTEPEIIVTDVYTTAPSTYLKCLAREWGALYGILLIMPVVALAAIGFVLDLRLVIVALALLFVVIPMVMTLLYFNYMLTPEARRAVLPKRVTIVPRREIVIDYEPTGDDSRRPAMPREIIEWDDIVGIRRRGRLTVFRLRGPRMQLFIVDDAAVAGTSSQEHTQS